MKAKVMMNTPRCCEAFMELKVGLVSGYIKQVLLYFQCKKCGNIIRREDD